MITVVISLAFVLLTAFVLGLAIGAAIAFIVVCWVCSAGLDVLSKQLDQARDAAAGGTDRKAETPIRAIFARAPPWRRES